jgi:uncharacterized membrane protein YcfT
MTNQSDDEKHQSDEERHQSEVEQLRKMIGGGREIADGAIPSVLFVAANALWSLQIAATVAIAYGVGATLYRLARKQGAQRALIGLVALAISVGIALRTGEASNYFVPGVIIGTFVGAITLATAATRRPLSATIAMAFEHRPAAYYDIPQVRRTHVAITVAWGLVSLARAGLRAYLIAKDQPELLGASAIILGYPLTLGLAGATIIVLRRLAARIEGLGVDPNA